MIFLDTETIGFHGLPIIIQYAVDDSEIKIWNFWTHSAAENINLLEWIADQDVCGFNLAFDWFHLCKMYTLCLLVADKTTYLDEINPHALAILEKEARDGPCLKPKRACDIMLHARKGPYQSTMDRGDIRIKRVPVTVAYKLARYLEEAVPLNDIYFARRADKTADKWSVEDILDDDEIVNKDFKNVVLKFKPSSALKALAVDALGLEVTKFSEVSISSALYPEEIGWAPYALSLPNSTSTWPYLIKWHIEHWEYDEAARKYSVDDVDYTRRLYHFFGSPEPGDDDSELACQVAACRWRGYAVDITKLRELRKTYLVQMDKAPRAASYCKKYLHEVLNPDEKIIIGNSTAKETLEALISSELWKDHPVVERAKGIMEARKAEKKVQICDKLIEAERLHASFKIIGTKSFRMSGTDKLNPQGIDRTKPVRKCFPLSFLNEELAGGDFESFEVAICTAVYPDSKLLEDLNTKAMCADCKGKGCTNCEGTGQATQKIHGLFAQMLVEEDISYDDVIMTKGTDNDLYNKGKSGVFSQMYFGTEYTLQTRLGISEKLAIKASDSWHRRYKELHQAQQKVVQDFTCVRQPKGLGTAVKWSEPNEYIDTEFGDRRYFTLEIKICRALFKLAENPPADWQTLGLKVRRRDKDQTDVGAMRSSLFGCVFTIQGSMIRAAGNHKIQCLGARITKSLQRKVWDLQPSGSHEFLVRPMNIHDELMVPHKPSIKEKLNEVVSKTVEQYKPVVPMLSIAWEPKLNDWSEK